MSLDTLLRSNNQITVLLEAQSSGGARYASNTGKTCSMTDSVAPNRAYPDWLTQVPEIQEKIPEELFGRSEIGWTECVISNPNGIRDSWLDEAWDGRDVTIKIGVKDDDLADFETVFIGVATGIQANGEGDLRLTFSDSRERFNRPIQELLLTAGPQSGDPYPITFGDVFNVEPPNTDTANHRYPVHDEAVSAIPDVRVGGLTVPYTPSVANGRFDLNVAPAGRVTADVTGPLSTAADFFQEICSRIGTALGITISVDSSAMSALDSAAPYGLGLWVLGRQNAIEVLDSIAVSVGAWWRFDSLDRFTAKVADIGTPTFSLTTDDIQLNGVQVEEVIIPRWRTRLGYHKNWAIQTDGLFAAVAEDDRQRFGVEYDISEVQDPNSPDAKSVHRLAKDPDIEGTLIVAQADADTECARRQELFGVLRKLFRIKATRRSWQIHAGDTVRVTYPRFGLDSGVDMLVLQISKRLDSRFTEFLAWA